MTSTDVGFDGVVTADGSKCVRVYASGRLAIQSHNHWSMMALLVSIGDHKDTSHCLYTLEKSQFSEMEGQRIHLEKQKRNSHGQQFNEWSQWGCIGHVFTAWSFRMCFTPLYWVFFLRQRRMHHATTSWQKTSCIHFFFFFERFHLHVFSMTLLRLARTIQVT